eukprot:9955805-Prorocentrum_lima.AAC.1
MLELAMASANTKSGTRPNRGWFKKVWPSFVTCAFICEKKIPWVLGVASSSGCSGSKQSELIGNNWQ